MKIAYPTLRSPLVTIQHVVLPAVIITLALIMGSGILCNSARAEDSGSSDDIHQLMQIQERLTGVNRLISREALLAGQEGRTSDTSQLQELRFTYQRLLNAIKKNMSTAQLETRLKQSMESGQAYLVPDKDAHSLSYYDRLLDQQSAVSQEIRLLESSAQKTAENLKTAQADLTEANQTWRRVKEEVTAKKGANAENDPRYIKAQWNKELAQARLDLIGANSKGIEKDLVLTGLKQQIADQMTAKVRQGLSFEPGALARETARLAEEKSDLQRRLQKILDGQKKFEASWNLAQGSAGQDTANKALKARETWQDAYESALQRIEQVTSQLNVQEKLWGFRYAILEGKISQTDLNAWKEEAVQIQKDGQSNVTSLQNRQAGLSTRISALEKEIESMGDITYPASELQALKQANEFANYYLATLLATGQLANRLLNEISMRSKDATLIDKIKARLFAVEDLWNLELWVIDDNGVTVKKVVTALGILIAGFFIVRILIRLLSRRLQKTKMDPSAVAALDKLFFYLGCVLVVLFSLNTVNIPLTAFTFLGGAIAIGVGFGTQNLINNLISGFIIMAERPIRIGDVIEVDGSRAIVEEIGARCTRIRTSKNIHILVPNSHFLEQSITNWTLSDRSIRLEVSVGVAYGSPVNKVRDLLEGVASELSIILENPKPFVVFTDFGDNALGFELRFWVRVKGEPEMARTTSQVRFKIYEVLEENDIVISFPQRDIHLDTASPLKIELLGKL
ncbi:mechanosensitive ion channel domain-containing protein [uncultured Desulfobacter sp.]|uniref:mechanosensitive ion channel domain-containing protein n=1 Tax=uncultured Desulfobacter sp. TaxID=240139 RepID=UPI002AAA9C0B|nr:mechanosensitive ion channel domain-containing protein [uncultured Desulfobacter sp.]